VITLKQWMTWLEIFCLIISTPTFAVDFFFGFCVKQLSCVDAFLVLGEVIPITEILLSFEKLL